MKKRSLLKGICAAIASSLLAAVLPVGALAADGEQTITVEFDTYIEKGKTDDFTGVEEIKFQDNSNNNYDREILLGFDLADISIPEGKQIDTAKINVYAASYFYNINGTNTKNASDLSMYAMGSVDYETVYDGVVPVWSNAYKSDKVKIATTTFCPENIFTAGEAYTFDISAYLSGKTALQGKEMFAIFPDTTSVSGSLHSMEKDDGKYAATLSVTLKDAESQEPSDPVDPLPVPDPVTIKAEYDTFVRDYKSNVDSSYNENTTFYVSVKGGNNKFGLVGFDMTQLKKEGYDVDTATLTIAVNGHKRTGTVNDTGAHSFSAYSIGTLDYTTTPAQTYNTALAGRGKTYMSSTIIAPEGTYAQKDQYSFDVSKYFENLEEYSKNQVFAIYADALTDEEKALGINTVETSFFTIEKNWGSSIPSLTVTYKVSDKEPEEEKTNVVLSAIDSRIVTDQANQNQESINIYRLRNFGNSYRSMAKFMFDTTELDTLIPAGKVITSAELKIYAPTKSYRSGENNKVNQGLRVVNYEDNLWFDPSVDSSAASHVTWTGTDENGEAWMDEDAQDVFTTDNVSVSGIEQLYAGMDPSEYEGSKNVDLNKWYSFDVTEFLMKQKNNEDAFGFVSFAVIPNVSENSTLEIANKWHENAPQLVVNFGDASELGELTIGEPTYTVATTGEAAATINGFTLANIPVSGASETPVVARIYVAEYNAEGGLVRIAEMNDFDFYQGNGVISYGFTPTEQTAKVKTFVWQGENAPIVASGEVLVSAE